MYEILWNIVCFLTLLGTVWNTSAIIRLQHKDKDHDATAS